MADLAVLERADVAGAQPIEEPKIPYLPRAAFKQHLLETRPGPFQPQGRGEGRRVVKNRFAVTRWPALTADGRALCDFAHLSQALTQIDVSVQEVHGLLKG